MTFLKQNSCKLVNEVKLYLQPELPDESLTI